MKKIPQEKLEIIDRVLNRYFNSFKYKKSKNCKKFKPEILAGYIEKALTKDEEKKYKNHLFNCKYCLRVYTNLENDINTLYRIKLRKISSELLTEALNFIDEENKKVRLEPDQESAKPDQETVNIIIKIREKGLELIEAINFNRIKPVPIPALRNKENILLKEISLEADYNDNIYRLRIYSFSNNRISMNISFSNNMYDEIKDSRLEIISKNIKIKKNIKKDMSIEELPAGKYKLMVNHSILMKFEAQ